ncbi:D-alanyl-D-alanine carboxypeptidase/D-alanyl-D-alanine endopeptidase [Herbiconiux liangxiaofengii]|uniref:D-alanyl-D-alanine carboxypeptidase/D-alanyl-D-alanine endopeptidase n=1 Tax=Herbiconiux liangxiaofengii TaxID=3342795 RepID=UPI0035BA67FA
MPDPEVPSTRREARAAAEAAAAAAAGHQAAAPASPPASPAAAPAAARVTLRDRIRRRPTAWAVGAAAVALALLGGGAFGAGAAVGAAQRPEAAAVAPATSVTPTETPEPAATPTPTADPRAVPQAVAAPAPVRTCSVADLAADPRLGTMLGAVRDATTGELLFDRGASTFARTASVMKVLSSAAALAVLGPDHRVPTTVVRGSVPGQVVLVGGGDITLASQGSNIYTDAASLPDLAAQTLAAWNADPATAGTSITSIVLDASVFSGDRWQSSWNRKELYDGYSSEVTGLQVDGDRADPSANVSARSENAVLRAGQAFALALGAPQANLAEGVAPAGAPQLGQVLSAPVSTMIPDALLRSDNTEAEMLARLVAVKLGVGNDFAALNTAIPQALAGYGLDTAGLTIVDGSGLSDLNGVSPAFLTQLFVKIQNREGSLGVIRDGLPVAGRSGTLAGRYGDSPAAGHVIAKTGWIDTGYTLSGIVEAADGTVLTFAVFALDDVGDSAKTAIDALVTGVYECGGNLANT